jgi:NADH:ubiquinone oxidoreductase subunit 2 (subunit N)
MVRNWLLGLTVIGALNAAIAAAYYLRLISTMYFRPSISVLKGQGGLGPAVAMFVALIAVIAVGAYPVPLVRDSGDASQSAYAAAVQVEPAPTLSLVAEKP